LGACKGDFLREDESRYSAADGGISGSGTRQFGETYHSCNNASAKIATRQNKIIDCAVQNNLEYKMISWMQ
jgi:hypothetical protein